MPTVPAFEMRSFIKKSAIALVASNLWICLPAWGQAGDEFLQSLIHQKLILRSVGDQQEITLKLKNDRFQPMSGSCDIAVLVREAAWNKRNLRLLLENIGTPSAGLKRPYCKMSYDNMRLQISGFAADESADSLRAAIGQILLTPEQYMAACGVSFDLAPAPDGEVAAKAPPPIQPVRALLTVDPVFSDEARRAKYRGTLVMSVLIGTDGRPHRMRVVRRLGMGLDEMALRAMPLWRFEPARQQDKPVAMETMIEVSFNLY